MHGYSSVALVDRRGWILFQERDEHPVIDPEKWGFPGGGVEDGETFEAAAYRELAEETGVRLEGVACSSSASSSVDCGECGDCPVAIYAGSVDLTDDDIECHEGRQMVFVEPTRALGLDLTASAASRPSRPSSSPTSIEG